ncbi:zinc finger CCCH domain-containing protein 24 [Humulus lupulus]|uniref:zinc finger CCCH domain-containing protein 24 n=1 Tax=Humulus lupulus TaxID=3486 RepID=UPI002B413410|nr:zinc finger CCCH domain-containing protein 24 [Humulus lupulus]
MAASSTNEHPPTETLTSLTHSVSTDVHDSIKDHHQPQAQPSDAALTDEIPPGEKRKREEDQEQDPGPNPLASPLWKTSLCSFFRRQSGSCSHGSTCRYAHGEEELRQRPDSTWDPTSEHAKKVQKKSEDEEKPVASISNEVMMTETVGGDGDEDGDGVGDGLDPGLSKCLVHLPRNWRTETLKSFLGEQGIPFKSSKKKKGMTVGFVSFESVEQLKTAMEQLEGKSIGNKSIKVADVIPRSFEKNIKPTTAFPQNGQETGKPAISGDDGDISVTLNGVQSVDGNEDNSTPNGLVSTGRSVRDVVTPLAHMTYSDQLELKKMSNMQILKKLTRNARKACPNGVSLPEWILKSREIGGLPCNLEGILPSPLVNGYRNKCEFSVGYSLQGKITVGFMLGNFREGVTAVEEPINCPNVSTIACKYASIFQEFLQHSDLPVWNRFKNTGFWRQLTVREGRRPETTADSENPEANIAEVLLMVQVSTMSFDDTLVASQFEKLARAFSAGAAANSPSLPLTALVVQDHQGISNVAPADAPLRQLPLVKEPDVPEMEADKNLVEPRIHDYISNLKFCISPTAFFQVNSLAAEKLYSLAGDWAGLGPDTLLFDICCGTGTIGLTLAHRVGMVVGVEMNASAVSDAHRNAEINGIKNCRFVCAKAEDVMGSLLKEYMSATQLQDEFQISEGDVEVSSITEEKDILVDNAEDPERSSCHSSDNIQEPGESSSQELQNVIIASECLDRGPQEPDSQLQSNCPSENGNPLVQRFKNVVAIVDPPRGGLHPTVIKVIRTNPLLRRLVYISCNPESLVANAIELCTPSAEKIEKGNKNNRGWRNMSAAGLARHRAKSMPNSEPFRPVKSMAVDLFPHTVHCEMVMLLER